MKHGKPLVTFDREKTLRSAAILQAEIDKAKAALLEFGRLAAKAVERK